jgi:hypothetical protein
LATGIAALAKTRQIMTIPTPETAYHPRRVPRWLSVLAVVLVAGVLIVLLALLLRRLEPQAEAWLRIAPAASTVDEATAIALSSGGWRPSEQVAICLNKPGDDACDVESVLLIETADPEGSLQTSVVAGMQLAEGRTTFLARGLESGRQASRSFRTLRAPNAPLETSGAETLTPPSTAAVLTPIPSGQPSDVLQPAGNGIAAGNAATIDPALDQLLDWRAEYFINPDLAGEPALTRNDPDPNLDWGEGSPAPGIIPPDGFSVRWSRSLYFTPGVYRFVLTAQDGGRLLVEGQPVIDAWQGAAGQTITADQALSGGQYQVVVHFRNLAGPARIAIGWSPLPTPTPALVAGVDPTPTPETAPTPTPPVAPGVSPTATPTNAAPTTTPTVESNTPDATETVLATSSVTASATPNGSATAETPGASTATPEPSTATPGPGATGTPQRPPGSEKMITINRPDGPPGQSIEIGGVDWSPGTVLQVSLGQFNTSYTEARPLSGVSYTTPIDRSRPWDWPLRFSFPNEPPWSNATLPVIIWVHNADWSEWGMEMFDVIP